MLKVIILFAMPELESDDLKSLLPLVSVERQKRIKEFKFKKDAQNCLFGDIIVRNEIIRITGLDNKELRFSKNPFGKPFFVNNPDIHFNVSHSGHYVASALSGESVGVDIETIKGADMRVAERFFAPDEIAYIADDAHRFYEIWTKKESRIKWEGKALSNFLRSRKTQSSAPREKLFYHKVFQNDKAVCHVCSANGESPSVEIIDASSSARGGVVPVMEAFTNLRASFLRQANKLLD